MFPTANLWTTQLLTPRQLGKVSPACVSSGFTIIELMVTVMVVAVLSAIAVPAMRTFVQNDRQWTQSSSLVMSLNFARNEAIKQDVSSGVEVCPSTDGLNCDPSGKWAEGWIVTAVPGAAIMTAPALPSGTSLTEATGQPSVTFLSTGMAAAPAAFTMCDNRGPAQARFTQVTKPGSVQSSLGAKTNGAALTCPP
jgi:type IV fimbrial biogenesis protein FimT